jgi:hypothetical protein
MPVSEASNGSGRAAGGVAGNSARFVAGERKDGTKFATGRRGDRDGPPNRQDETCPPRRAGRSGRAELGARGTPCEKASVAGGLRYCSALVWSYASETIVLTVASTPSAISTTTM